MQNVNHRTEQTSRTTEMIYKSEMVQITKNWVGCQLACRGSGNYIQAEAAQTGRYNAGLC